jgi:hypothetical protein
MRSRPALPATGFALLLMCTRCDSLSARAESICEAMANCTAYIAPGDCTEQIEDAIKDYRLSRRALASCSRCIENHTSPASGVTGSVNECNALLVSRDCDVACHDVMVVTNAASTRSMRSSLCETVEANCGHFTGETPCADQLLENLKAAPISSALAKDQRVAACANCVRLAAVSPVDAGGNSIAGCRAVTDACVGVCAGIEPVVSGLRAGIARATVCTRVRGCCVGTAASPDETDASAGSPPNALDSGIPSLRTDGGVLRETADECFQKLLVSGASTQALIACQSCADPIDECSALCAACNVCQEFF